jgi:hypothetical protein
VVHCHNLVHRASPFFQKKGNALGTRLPMPMACADWLFRVLESFTIGNAAIVTVQLSYFWRTRTRFEALFQL